MLLLRIKLGSCHWGRRGEQILRQLAFLSQNAILILDPQLHALRIYGFYINVIWKYMIETNLLRSHSNLRNTDLNHSISYRNHTFFSLKDILELHKQRRHHYSASSFHLRTSWNTFYISLKFSLWAGAQIQSALAKTQCTLLKILW